MSGDMNVEQGICAAIKEEIKAYMRYRKAGEKTDSPTAKALYGSLARDEMGHQKSLEDQYLKLFGKEPPSPQVQEGESMPEGIDEMQILTIAMEAEVRAHNTYKELQELTTDNDAKELFARLADEERGHEQLLNAEYLSRTGQPWQSDDLNESMLRDE